MTPSDGNYIDSYCHLLIEIPVSYLHTWYIHAYYCNTKNKCTYFSYLYINIKILITLVIISAIKNISDEIGKEQNKNSNENNFSYKWNEKSIKFLLDQYIIYFPQIDISTSSFQK